MFCLGVFTFLSMVLNSSPQLICLPLPRLLADLLYCCNTLNNGGPLGNTAKLGLQANRLSCTVVKGLLEVLMTHLALCGSGPVTVAVVTGFEIVFSSVSCCIWSCSPWLPCRWFEQPPVFLWHNPLNLFICLIWVLMCLDSLLALMNTIHPSMVSLSKMPFNQFIHVSICIPNMVMVLFTVLILSFSSAFSALLMML